MVDVNNISAAEFKKCGEIMFAGNWNKIAMSCNFCHLMFKQLQTFVRHLRIDHSDDVEFVKEAEEVEVYAIEELINQTVNSGALGMESDDSKTDWLNEEDMNWLDEGVEPKNKPHAKKEASNATKIEDDMNVTNISILRALEDCDVSLNMMGKYNSTKCSNEQEVSRIGLQSQWEYCDASVQQFKKVEAVDIEKLNSSKYLLEANRELGPVTNNGSEEANVEQSISKRIKRLLENLDNNENVDNLLISLESHTPTHADNKVKECNSNSFSQVLTKNAIGKEVLNTNLNNAETNCLDNLEPYLQELEIAADADTSNSNTSTMGKYVMEASNIDDNKALNFDKKLKDLEESLTLGNAEKLLFNNKSFYTDLEKELSIFNETDTDKDVKFLKEDLTKVLVDALDSEDVDLLNLQLEEENVDPLNKDILDILECELLEKELEKDNTGSNKRQLKPDSNSSSDNVIIKEKFTKPLKVQCKNINANNSIKTAKYRKTNIKARKKSYETSQPNCTISSVLKESNSIFVGQIAKNVQTPSKENCKIFLSQQLSSTTSNVKSPTITFIHNNTNQIDPSTTRKNANKENLVLNIAKIKKEELSPCTSFINKEKRYSTPVKREEIYLKESRKTQEKLKTVTQNIAPNVQNFKQTRKTQKKQEHSHQQPAPVIVCQKTPQFENKEGFKQSPKPQEKSISPLHSGKVPKNNDSPDSKIDNITSPQKVVITQFNENSIKPITGVCHLYSGDKTSLATPSRKLKKFAIKLQRCTPDKLANALKHKTNATEIDAKHIRERFKLPKQITLTAEATHNSKALYNHCEIIKKPRKDSTYGKQSFSKSCKQNVQLEKTKEQSCDEKRLSLIKAERKVNNSAKLRQRTDIFGTVSETTKRHCNLDCKSYALNRSSPKKEVLQRMRNIKKQIFKSIEGSESLTTINNKQSPFMNRKKRQNVVIQNVTMLANLDQETLTPIIFNNKNPLNNFSTSTKMYNSSKEFFNKQNSINNKAENSSKVAIKRPAISAVQAKNDFAKRQHISLAHKQNEEKMSTELEKTQLDLSESCVDFLQRDLKASRLSVESLLNSAMPECDVTLDETSLLLNDLLQQVVDEKSTDDIAQPVNTADKTGTSTNSNTIIDFDEAKDIDLLAKFGLKVLKLPEIEDAILLEERDEMNVKARKFANIYKNWPKIWSPKNSEYLTSKADLDKTFKDLLAETNTLFNLKLNLIEIKRLVNIINFWFARNICSRFIEKRKISDSTNRYLSYFFYIPKTIRHFYYCEYCEEYFNTEHKYYIHRIIHTGALYPYECQKCSVGFRALKQLKKHELCCNNIMAKTITT